MTQNHNFKDLSKTDYIDILGVLGISLYALGSSVFGSSFAELNTRFSFLNFPIFISEWLLSFCLILLFLKLWLTQGWLKWYWLWVVYFVWVLILALVGYLEWGPLALRNAALFYYPWFAFLGYSFYNRRIFANKMLSFPIFGILVLLMVLNQVQAYFWFTYLLLIVIFIFKILPFSWRFPAIILVLVLSHMDNLFVGSRTHMVAIWGALLFLIYANRGLIYKVPFKIRVCLVAVFVIAFFIGVTKVSDQNAVNSMLKWDTLVKRYKYEKKHILTIKKSSNPQIASYKLYNPNRKSSDNQLSTQGGEIFKNEIHPSSRAEILKPQQVSVPQEKVMINEVSQSVPDKVNERSSSQHPTYNLYNPNMPDAFMNELNYKMAKLNTFLEASSENSSKSGQLTQQNSIINETTEDVVPTKGATPRDLDIAVNNILFRVFIWEDMFEELRSSHKFLGVGFGKPQRSPSIEALEWGFIEWNRDGWITPHNSFFHIIYRTGVLGVGLIIMLLLLVARLAKDFYKMKSVEGGFLVGALVYWLVLSNFLVILELPYNAVLFWSLFGLTWAYRDQLEEKVVK